MSTVINRVLLDNWIEMLTKAQITRLQENDLDCWANIVQAKATVNRDGRRYIAIAIGTGMRYFIDKQTGLIHPSASWKKPNLKRSFGTLDTVKDFDWGGYEAVSKPGTPWVMKTLQHYQTAVPV
jgi:hypothetical protein|tara:strand:- start:58 stop:429 length:372 start_codon:yes stop_codon:yes gene_type:complete